MGCTILLMVGATIIDNSNPQGRLHMLLSNNNNIPTESNCRPYAKRKVVLPVKRKHCLHVCDPSWLFHEFAGFYD
jgi:hypothetical protein